MPLAVYRGLLVLALALVVLTVVVPAEIRSLIFTLAAIVFVAALASRWPGRER